MNEQEPLLLIITMLLTAITLLLGIVGFFARGKFGDLADKIIASHDTFSEDSARQWEAISSVVKTATRAEAKIDAHIHTKNNAIGGD